MRELAEATAELNHAWQHEYGEDTINELKAEVSAIMKRQDYQDLHYFVEIDCPEHLTHKAKLFTNGHRYAGVWECEIENISDGCPHFDVEVIEDEDFDGHKYRYYACVLDGLPVDGDPDADSEDYDES